VLLDIDFFWKGIIVGLMVSVPLGPIGLLCIQRTLNKGRRSGFVSGLGASAADTIFALIAGFGITYIIEFIREQHIYFQAIGGVIIIILGIHVFFTNPIQQLRMQRMSKSRLSQDFLSVFIIMITNPMAILFFLAIFAGMNVHPDKTNLLTLIFVVSGVFAGSAAWWFLISAFVNFWRDRFRLKIIWWMNKLAGVSIFILGIASIVSIWVV